MNIAATNTTGSVTRFARLMVPLAMVVLALGGCQPADGPIGTVSRTAKQAAKGPLHQRAHETEKNPVGEVVGMALMFDAVSDADLQQLADYPQLANLRLQECPRVHGAGLAAIASLPALTTLSILNTPIDDDSLRALSQAPALVDLTLQRTRITGKTLADLPLGLQRLELGGRGIDPAAFQSLRQFADLRELGLHLLDRPLRDLPPLAPLARLETLDLTGTQVDDEGLKRLAALGALKVVRFEPKEVTDAGAATLAALPHLSELDLATSQITAAGLENLAALAELQVLWLPRGVSDAGLAHLQSLSQLRVLELRHTRIDGTGLKHLARLTNLRELILPNRRLSEEGKQALRELRKSLPECYIAVAGGG